MNLPKKIDLLSKRNIIEYYLVHFLSIVILKSVFVVLMYNFFEKYLISVFKSLLEILTLKIPVNNEATLKRSIMSIIWRQLNVFTFYLYIETSIYTIGCCGLTVARWACKSDDLRVEGSKPVLVRFSLNVFAMLYFGIVCLLKTIPLYTMRKWMSIEYKATIWQEAW